MLIGSIRETPERGPTLRSPVQGSLKKETLLRWSISPRAYTLNPKA